MSKTDAVTKGLVMQAAKAAGDDALASNGGRVPPYPGLDHRVPSSIKLSDLGSLHQDLPALQQAPGGLNTASYCTEYQASKQPHVVLRPPAVGWLLRASFNAQLVTQISQTAPVAVCVAFNTTMQTRAVHVCPS